MMNFGYYQPLGFFGPILMILWWVIIVVAIIAFVRWIAGYSGVCHHGHGGENKALDILKERFAKGEINEKEFEEKKKILME